MRTKALVRVGLGILAVSLGLLAGCAPSPERVASDRGQNERACARASIGLNDRGYVLLPFDIDRDAYRRCLEERGYHLPLSRMQAP